MGHRDDKTVTPLRQTRIAIIEGLRHPRSVARLLPATCRRIAVRLRDERPLDVRRQTLFQPCTPSHFQLDLPRPRELNSARPQPQRQFAAPQRSAAARFRLKRSRGFVAEPMLYWLAANPSRRRTVRSAAEGLVFHGTKRSAEPTASLRRPLTALRSTLKQARFTPPAKSTSCGSPRSASAAPARSRDCRRPRRCASAPACPAR